MEIKWNWECQSEMRMGMKGWLDKKKWKRMMNRTMMKMNETIMKMNEQNSKKWINEIVMKSERSKWW